MHYVSFSLMGDYPACAGLFGRARPSALEAGSELRRRLPPARSSFWPASLAGILILTALVVVGSSTSGETTVTMSVRRGTGYVRRKHGTDDE